MKVLLVDSSRASRGSAAAFLREMGNTVAEAANGSDGLLAYLREVPDAVLLDTDLPGINGYEVAREIRRQDQDGCWTPIIFVGVRPAEEEMAVALEAGGDDYIAKPLNPAVLRARLTAVGRLTTMRKRLVDLERQLQETNRSLVRLSTVDALTNIPNRHSFDTSLDREWRLGLRTGLPLALILGDIDYFKRFNDRYGHRAGDECLRSIAGTLVGAMRSGADMVARIGGETFAVLLPETPVPRALEVAESLQQAVRALAIPHAASEAARYVTLSLGVAVRVPGTKLTSADLIDGADRALIEAKRDGRNRSAFEPQAQQRLAS